MKLGLFKYSNSTNVGDFIQTLAVAQHIDQEYELIDRDFMNEYDGDPMAVVMNGWFTDEPDNWPPSPAITPIFFGFHISRESVPLLARHKAYFSRFAPIGCRDHATANHFKACGIDAYVTGCATMTFPRRLREPENPRTLLVDEPIRHFRRDQRKGLISISHELESYMSSDLRFQAAHELLAFYREHAGLIITKRIHCAMPCAAMGIPVIFSDKRDGRTAIIDIIGIQSRKIRRFPKNDVADFSAVRLEFEAQKQEIADRLHEVLAAHGIKTRMPESA